MPGGSSSMSKRNLSDYLEKIEAVKAEVRELYILIPNSSQFDSPRTNAIGFLDSLLGNLKKMLEAKVNFLPFVDRHLEMVWGELESLRPFMQNITELRKGHQEFEDRWRRTINVVYFANYVISLLSVEHVHLWYTIVCLSNVIEDIKLIKIELKKINDSELYIKEKLSTEMKLTDALLLRATTPRIEGVFIRFKEDAKSIMDQLIGGRKDLTIISISGMPGQGKTTSAKRIYKDPSIQYHFEKLVWCYASKECKMRELLIKIISEVTNIDVESLFKLENYDLVECLWKRLRQRKYLIVLDDIWNIDVWHGVQDSFPDDGKGSRIMFTSRNHNLVSQVKQNSISHPLPLFSDEQSWELMKKKLFSGNSCGPEFEETGKQIANYCKGLPLSVVLIASLLGRTEQTLDF